MSDRRISFRIVKPGLRRYVRLGHRRVAGWIEAPILVLMVDISNAQRAAGVTGGVAEIGVHHGRFFIGLHLTREANERSVAIDIFGRQDLNIDASGSGDETAFRAALGRHAGGERDVTVLAADSRSVDGARVQELVGGAVRLFSVDGGHTAELVHHDMRTAADSIAKGGVIVGDDVFNFNWPETVEGTLRFLNEREDVVPFAIAFNKVLFTHRATAASYRRAVSQSCRQHLWSQKSSRMHGEPVEVVWVPPLKTRARLVVKAVLRRADHSAE